MAVQTLFGGRAALGVLLVALAAPAIAGDTAPARTGVATPSVEELAMPDPASNARDTDTREAMCLMIESAARANDLPLEFFARVIWQESRFQTDAVGPVTRNGQRAQGIAQFMPGTASERRLLDPFDPVQALPKSAEFLSELRNQFGNLGLAAAAYNAGPRRVQEWPKSRSVASRSRCRRRPATTSARLPALRSTTGPGPVNAPGWPIGRRMPAAAN